MKRYRKETNQLLKDRKKHNDIYKKLLFEFQSNVPQQQQRIQVEGTFSGKYEVLVNENLVK